MCHRRVVARTEAATLQNASVTHGAGRKRARAVKQSFATIRYHEYGRMPHDD